MRFNLLLFLREKGHSTEIALISTQRVDLVHIAISVAFMTF